MNRSTRALWSAVACLTLWPAATWGQPAPAGKGKPAPPAAGLAAAPATTIAGQLKELDAAVDLKPADRRAVAERVAKAIGPMVDKATDPAALQQEAFELTSAGVTPTLTELEYFGESTEAQAQLNPVAAEVKHMLQRANALATAAANKLLVGMNNSNITQRQAGLKALKPLRLGSEFSDNMATYALCVSLPKDSPQRAADADAAIKYLTQWDTPKSGIQAGVHYQTGKLQLAKGDYAAAKGTLTEVATGTAFKPLPTDQQQNDARYFAAVADLLAGDLTAADGEVKSLADWEQVNYLPKLDAAQQSQVKAALAMLQFRLASGQADAAAKAGNDADKAKDNGQAVTILSTLLQENPDPALQALVFDQLVGRIPEHPDMATADPLVLQALLQQGYDEYDKKDGEPFDRAALARAIDAARELSRRGGKPGVSQQLAVKAAYFVPYALDLKLHDDAAAAAAYMDFMERFPAEPDKDQDCMQHAGGLVFKLHAAAVARNAPDPAEAELYDRFLPLAVNPPYDQKQVAIDYADVLRGQGKYAEAVKYYRMVEPKDPHYAAAQFREMLALYSMLGDSTHPLPADQQPVVAGQLQRAATDVDKTATAALAAAKDDAAKQPLLGQIAIARFDAAISARRDLKDPAKSLSWLDGFDDKIKGLKNEAEFAQTVLVQRINDYMDQGKTSDATDALVKLLQADPSAGETQLFALIQQIDQDLVEAKGRKDVPAERQLATNKATLSGFLVTYGQTSKDPKIRVKLPAFRLYDADSKRQAAELTEDPTARAAALTTALHQYQTLAASPPADLAAAGVTADQVQLGVGLTQYDLADYKAALAALGPLVGQRRVGLATTEVNGQTVENPQYWEATYKDLRSMYELVKASPNDPKAKADASAAAGYLGSQFVLYGDHTGGAGYHDACVQLRDDLKPWLPVVKVSRK